MDRRKNLAAIFFARLFPLRHLLTLIQTKGIFLIFATELCGGLLQKTTIRDMKKAELLPDHLW